MKAVEIPLSKSKLFFGIGGSILFVFLGYYLIDTASERFDILYRDFVKILGIVCILFFALTGVFCIKKLFDKSAGLRIDELGITDNTSAVSVGFIAWEDVVNIKTKQVSLTKMLLVYIRNAEAYMDNQNKVKRQLLKSNFRLYGTPVVIAATSLQCKFSELEKLVRGKFHERLTGQYK